jgi:hypothetical protein
MNSRDMEVLVTRFRIPGGATLLALGALGAVTVPLAGAAAPGTKVTCIAQIVQQLPAGQTAMVPLPAQGTQAGSISCDKLFGAGVQADAFTQQDDGCNLGPYTQYFATGTIHGKLHLVPADQTALSLATFARTNFAGTITVTAGTGAFQGARAKGTVTCTSPDSLHLTCTEKLNVTAQ